MYSILFHISGIAILEICFFFYYVGPIETKMFEKTVRRLSYEPVESLQNLIVENQLSSSNLETIKNILFPHISSTINVPNYNLGTELYENNIRGKNTRENKNRALFLQTVEYWTMLCSISIFVFFIQCKYDHYRKMQKDRGLITMGAEPSMEMIEARSYRKGSIDYDSQLNLSESERFCNSARISYAWKTFHYALFGGCVVLFQYLFFQNVVFFYDPLSIDEVKYLMYQAFEPEFAKYNPV